MPTIPEIFAEMPNRYVPGIVTADTSYYFSVGEHKYTIIAKATECIVLFGKHVQNADCVIVSQPNVFINLVIHGRRPSSRDLLLKRFKVSDLSKLMQLKELFEFQI